MNETAVFILGVLFVLLVAACLSEFSSREDQ